MKASRSHPEPKDAVGAVGKNKTFVLVPLDSCDSKLFVSDVKYVQIFEAWGDLGIH